jgi:hypothetical protein
VFALAANLIVSTVLTIVFALVGPRDRADETRDEDYSEFRREVASPTAGVAH